MAPAGCVAMEEALPWRPLPWRWRPAQQGLRASQGGSPASAGAGGWIDLISQVPPPQSDTLSTESFYHGSAFWVLFWARLREWKCPK